MKKMQQFDIDQIDNIRLYISPYTNDIMEAVGSPPIFYMLVQFRNTITGNVELFKKRIFVPRNISREHIGVWVLKRFVRYVNDRLGQGYYKLIRFEDAAFSFIKIGRKSIGFNATAFYNEQEKQNDEFYRKIRIENEKRSCINGNI